MTARIHWVLLVAAAAACGPTRSRHARPPARVPPRPGIERAIRGLEAAIRQPGPDPERAQKLGRLAWLLLVHRPEDARAGAFLAESLRLQPDAWSDLGLALLAEAGMRPKTAASHYERLLDHLASGQSALLNLSAKCSLGRFAATRLLEIGRDLARLSGLSALRDLPRRLGCPVVSALLGRLVVEEALRRGRAELARKRRARWQCADRWLVGPRRGSLGEQDLPGRPEWSGEETRAPGCILSVTSPDGARGIRMASFGLHLRRERRLLLVVQSDVHHSVFVDGRRWSGPRPLWSWPAGLELLCGKFPPGRHVVTVGLPVGPGPSRIAVWILDARTGAPARARTTRPGPATRPATPTVCPRRVVVPEPRGPMAPLARLLRFQDAMLRGRQDLAERELERLAQSPFALGILRAAAAWPGPPGSTPAEARHEREVLLRRVARRLPNLAEPAGLLALVLSSQEKWREALGVVRKAAARSLPGPWGYVRARILADRGWYALARRALRNTVSQSRTPRVLRLALELASQAGSEQEALQVARRLAAVDRTSDALARQLAFMGRAREASAEYERLHALTGRRQALVGRLRAAASGARPRPGLLQEVVHSKPADSDARLLAADLLAAAGLAGRARGLLAEGLRRTPTNRALRHGLAYLGGLRMLDEFRIDGLAAVRAYLRSGGKPGRGPIYIVDRMVTWVLDTGATLELSHALVHLRPGSDLGFWGQVRVRDGVEILALRVIKKDGRVVVPPRPSDAEPWHLPDLEEGDFVEFEFLEAFDPLWVQGGGFAGRRFYFAGFRAATLGSTYVLVTPRGMPVDIDARAGAGAPRVRSYDRWIVRTWQGTATPRLRRAPASPPPVTYVPSVRVGSRASWRFVAGMVRRHVLEADRPTGPMRDLARKLCRGTPAEQVRRVWKWVSENVEQAGSFRQAAGTVLRHRSGYRLNLVRSLLRLCGLEPRTLLVVPRHGEYRLGPVADPTPFRYPVLAVPTDQEHTAYLFPFMREIPVDYLPAMLRGGLALEVDPNPGKFGRLPSTLGRDQERLQAEVRLLPGGRVEVSVREELEGWSGMLLARALRRLGRHRFRRQVERHRISSLLPGATLQGKIRFSWSPERGRLVLKYRIRSTGIAKTLERGKILRLRTTFRPLGLSRRYPTDRRRRADLLLGSFADFELEVTFRAPRGYAPGTPPGKTAVRGPFGILSRRVSRSGRSLVFLLRRKVPFHRIPARQLPSFRSFARRFDELETLEAVFRRVE